MNWSDRGINVDTYSLWNGETLKRNLTKTLSLKAWICQGRWIQVNVASKLETSGDIHILLSSEVSEFPNAKTTDFRTNVKTISMFYR